MNAESHAAPVQPGDLVAGKYRVDRVLGHGGMGLVVGARHEQLGQRVALKFLLPEVTSQSGVVQRFLREAQAAVNIQSDHVARVLDVGVHDGTPYMVMEYLEGSDLGRLLSSGGPVSVAKAVGYVLQACEAIAEAHAQGIVHRDLKPANLFLTRKPNGMSVVKVLDFGISKVLAKGGGPGLTKTSAIMGSPSYMSPEQLIASADVDVRADVWALGVVLYELVSGQPPFVASTIHELIALILYKAHVPLVALRPDVPLDLSHLLDRCLTKEPASRVASVADLARGLVPFGPPESAQLVAHIEHVAGLRTALPSASPRRAEKPSSPAVKRSAAMRLGQRAILISAAVLGVALVGTVAVGSWRRHATPPVSALPSSPAPAGSVSAPEPNTAPSDPSTASPGTGTAPAAMDTAPPAPSGSSQERRLASEPTVDTHAHGGGRRAGAANGSPPAPRSASPTAAASAAPTCRIVPRWDEKGEKHFVEECAP